MLKKKIKIEGESVYQIYTMFKKLRGAGFNPHMESFCGSQWVIIT